MIFLKYPCIDICDEAAELLDLVVVLWGGGLREGLYPLHHGLLRLCVVLLALLLALGDRRVREADGVVRLRDAPVVRRAQLRAELKRLPVVVQRELGVPVLQADVPDVHQHVRELHCVGVSLARNLKKT